MLLPVLFESLSLKWIFYLNIHMPVCNGNSLFDGEQKRGSNVDNSGRHRTYINNTRMDTDTETALNGSASLVK